jgi:hypothetical protein
MWGWLKQAIQWEGFRNGPLFDGTLSDLGNAIYVDNSLKPERYLEQLEPRSNNDAGYVQLKVRDFKTRSVSDYEELVNDSARWSDFEKTVMGRYFDDKIEMFPVIRREYLDIKRRDFGDGVGFDNPEAFQIVQKEMIERRFSADRSDEIGERDLRDAIAAFRSAFLQNFWRLVTSRRSAAAYGVFASLLVLLAFAAAFNIIDGIAKSSVWIAVISVVGITLNYFIWLACKNSIDEHTKRYEEATKANCNILAGLLGIRLHSLTEIIPQLFHKIDNSKWQMLRAARLDAWPMEVKKWSKLAFWLSARVEHIELLMQVQMWRIRRLHYGIRWIGKWLTRLIHASALSMVIAEFFLIWNISSIRGVFRISDPVPIVACTVFALITLVTGQVLAWMSFHYNITDYDIIRRTLKTDTMKRFSDVRLHRQVAEHVADQKESQVYNETLMKR